ncbi:unnamed protein product [Aphanomyces euteiches]
MPVTAFLWAFFIASATADQIVRLLLARSYAQRRLEDGGAQYNEQSIGAYWNTHFAELYLGIPPQRATVIIDTASAFTAVACSSCANCNLNGDRPAYNPAKSTTVRNVSCLGSFPCTSCPSKTQCTIHQRQEYADGSAMDAFVVQEQSYIGALNGGSLSSIVQANAVPLPVGCQTSVGGQFKTQNESGILGMQQNAPTILAAMVSASRVARNVFSLCFDATGGTFVLGGQDLSLHDGPTLYTPLAKNEAKYWIDLVDIFVGNASLGIASTSYVGYGGGRTFLLDSGSTISRLPGVVYDEFVNRLYRAGLPTASTVLSIEQIQTLPRLKLVLRGVTTNSTSATIDMGPEQYVLIDPSTGRFILGFSRGLDLGGVLGANFMLHYDVLFDLEKQQIGFAKANCSRTQATESVLIKGATVPPTTFTNVTTPTTISNPAMKARLDPFLALAVVAFMLAPLEQIS